MFLLWHLYNTIMPFKKIILSSVLLATVFVALAFPAPAFAQGCTGIAGWLGNIFGCTVDAVVASLARFLAGAIVAVPGMIFFVVAGIANFLMFATVNAGIAPGSGPLFVDAGWEFSRNFVNMLFLLILVFIGLATILRLREYELQRTLPRLLLMALLVNFSGLLVGFIADVGNIATMMFLRTFEAGFGSESFNNIFQMTSNQASTFFDSSSGLDLGIAFAYTIAMAVVTGFFFIFSAIAFLAITLVFFIRLVVLWTLVILAPFAFISYILPATRPWWNRWWSTLIQWGFITVPLAFFMMLANMILQPSNAISFPTQPQIAGNAGFLTPIIEAMLSPVVAIVLLFIGLGMSASMSASFQRVRRYATKAAVVGAGVFGGKALYDKFRQRVAESDILRRMETASAGGTTRRSRILTNIPGVTAGARWAGRNVRGRARESLIRDAEKAENDAKNRSSEVLVSQLGGRLPTSNQVGILNALAKRDDIDEAFDLGLTNQRAVRIAQEARRFDMHRDIVGAIPFTQEARMRAAAAAPPHPAVLSPTERRNVGQQYYDDILSRLTPERFGRISRRAFDWNRAGTGGIDDFNNPALMEGLVRNVTSDRMGAFLRRHGERGAQSMEEFIMRLTPAGTGGADWLRANNQRLADYIENNPAARGLFDRARLGF